MKNKYPFWTKLDWHGPRPLTLRELIMKSNFDAMMENIIDFDPKMANQAPCYLRSCEYIRDLKVKYDERFILAKNQDGKPFIMDLEGVDWKTWLGSPVMRTKDLHCTDAELAAQCLWHLTFYGYTPEEQRAFFEQLNESEERQRRNDEFYLDDEHYTDEEIKASARLGFSRIRDKVLERLFAPEEIIEIKRIHKERLDEENARYDAADEEERKEKEQEAALKMERRKKAEQEKREEWYRRRRQSRHRRPKKKRHGKRR